MFNAIKTQTFCTLWERSHLARNAMNLTTAEMCVCVCACVFREHNV